MIGPEAQQGRIKLKPKSPEADLNDGALPFLKTKLQICGQGTGITADKTDLRLGKPPVHGQIKRAAQKMLPASVGKVSFLCSPSEGLPLVLVDGVPSEVAHPHQNRTGAISEIGCSRWNITDDENRLILFTDPATFPFEQRRQMLIEACQCSQCPAAIHLQCIALNHADIPAAAPNAHI